MTGRARGKENILKWVLRVQDDFSTWGTFGLSLQNKKSNQEAVAWSLRQFHWARRTGDKRLQAARN